MSKAPPPLLGFNNNVRHRGRIFHIQTEDSGVKFPRIVTHLFADGGRIVKTTRTDYSEHLEKADMATVVRGMMKEQHKAMFAALRAGDLDHLLETVCGPLEPAKPRGPESVADLTSRHDLETARVVVASTKPRETSNLPAPVALGLQVTQPAPPGGSSLREADDPLRPRRPISNPNLRKPTPSVTPPAPATFELDVASLDHNPPKPVRAPGPPGPPPPRPPRKSSPRKSRPPIPQRPAPPPPPPPIPRSTAPTPSDGPQSLGRPQTRLAAAPPSNARSIFGDGAISEQSLDEVILSYLAEDLEEPK